MLPRLRSSCQIALVSLSSWRGPALGVIGASWGLITLSFGGPLWSTVLAWGLAVGGAGSAVADLRTANREAARLYIYNDRASAALALQPSDLYAEFADHRWGYGRRYLSNPALNAALNSSVVRVEVRGQYRMPKSVADLRPFLLLNERREGNVIFDDKKVRLADDLTVARLSSSVPIRLERTTYFASICTNEIVDKEIRVRSTDIPRLRGIDLCADSGVLLDLSQSLCSNHIGVSTLALTRDGYLVTTVQAAGSAQYSNSVAPSGSGSADLADVLPGDTLRMFVVRAMERELAEECGLGSKSGLIATALTGYARLIERGGKPEFFGFTRVDASRSEIRVTRKESVFVAETRGHRIDRNNLLHGLNQLCDREESAFSPSMHVALELLMVALRRQDPAVLSLIEVDRLGQGNGVGPVG